MDLPTNYQLAKERVNLVERNTEPINYHLIDSYRTAVHDEQDILTLARSNQLSELIFWQNCTAFLTQICSELPILQTIQNKDEKIRILQSKIIEILGSHLKSKIIHDAACNFQKKVGMIYHLYRRNSGQQYLSMMSPLEWGDNLQHEFLGSFHLEPNQQWTPIDESGKYFFENIEIAHLAIDVVSKIVDD